MAGIPEFPEDVHTFPSMQLENNTERCDGKH